MSKTTSLKPKMTVPYSTRPRSLPPDELEEIIRRVKVIISEVADIRTDVTKRAAEVDARKKGLLLRLSNYLSKVKIAQLLLHISPNAQGFDDHDLVASLVLHQFNYYEHVRHPRNPGGRWYIDRFVHQWMEILPTNKQIVLRSLKHHRLRSRPEVDFSKPNLLDIGILTVLEHEYQSVIRRLDRIYACSGDYAEGRAIHYRAHPADDLKDISTRLRDFRRREVGWTVGLIGSETVIVICVGDVGKDNAKNSIAEIQARLNLGVENWLDVGVCAGTNKNWPIGTVLMSDSKIIDLKRLGTAKFEETNNVLTPLPLPLPAGKKFSLQESYRRAPRAAVKNISVASPSAVPVHHVKFACVPDVIRGDKDREAIRSLLVQAKYLSPNEEFGIEMEAAGTTLYGDLPTMCIIKGVCDYADNSKGSWPSGTKKSVSTFRSRNCCRLCRRPGKRLEEG